jgi:hypothetical protein
MKNVYLISTDKPSRLRFFCGRLELMRLVPKKSDIIFQHIYITNDDEIKEGDKDFYIIANDRDKTWINRIEKVIECKIDPKHGKVLILSSGFIYIDEGCKIILTTDGDLITDGVQAIDDEFLEWFVNNPSCEFVEVNLNSFGECHMKGDGCSCYDTTDQSLCELHYPNYKIIIPKEEPKQETLYEAAEKYAEHQLTGIDDKFSKFECINDFIAGAEFQQQQDKNKYSEEEVRQMLWDLGDVLFNNNQNGIKEGEPKKYIEEIIEQFKKK